MTNRKRHHPEDDYFHKIITQLSQKRIKVEERKEPQSAELSGWNLSYQAKYVSNLIFTMKKTNWTKYDRECFLVSIDWFNKWAQYSNFFRYFNASEGKLNYYNIEDQDKENQSENNGPGRINNLILMVDQKEYYRNFSHRKAKCNYALKDTLEEQKDYYVLTKEIWNYLHTIYGGDEFARDCIFLNINGRIKSDIKMLKVIYFYIIGENSNYKKKSISIRITKKGVFPL